MLRQLLDREERSGRMATKGQTHQKRARELARRERRELKQAKKAARAAGELPAADDAETPPADADSETAEEEIQ
jgi:hypothetical protein